MQTLTIGGKDYAVVPMGDYNTMLELAENTQDMADIMQCRKDLANGREEMIPGKFAERLIFGENPYLVWREYRGLTLQNISDATGISVATLSRIENNKREPSIKQLKAIAAALRVDASDLI